MSKITIEKVKEFVADWIDEKILESGLHSVGQLSFQYTPDTLHMGRGTYPLAYKNRVANFMVVPDLSAVKFYSHFEPAHAALSQCWKPRQAVRQLDVEPGGWEWYDIPGLVWPLAPVDVLCPTLQHCDLATLQHRSLPVLTRWCNALLRRYVRAKDAQDLRWLGNEWDKLTRHFEDLSMTVPLTAVQKRMVLIAKTRLTQN